MHKRRYVMFMGFFIAVIYGCNSIVNHVNDPISLMLNSSTNAEARTTRIDRDVYEEELGERVREANQTLRNVCNKYISIVQRCKSPFAFVIDEDLLLSQLMEIGRYVVVWLEEQNPMEADVSLNKLSEILTEKVQGKEKYCQISEWLLDLSCTDIDRQINSLHSLYVRNIMCNFRLRSCDAFYALHSFSFPRFYECISKRELAEKLYYVMSSLYRLEAPELGKCIVDMHVSIINYRFIKNISNSYYTTIKLANPGADAKNLLKQYLGLHDRVDNKVTQVLRAYEGGLGEFMYLIDDVKKIISSDELIRLIRNGSYKQVNEQINQLIKTFKSLKCILKVIACDPRTELLMCKNIEQMENACTSLIEDIKKQTAGEIKVAIFRRIEGIKRKYGCYE